MSAQKQFIISLYFFVAIAFFGLLLRTVPVYSLPINFSNFLHAHSHVAFLGWLHGAFISFVCYIFLKNELQTKNFRFIYFFTIINIAGMYFSFPIQGYKLFSIIFLSLFLVSTYLFLTFFFKHKQNTAQYPATYKFIKSGLLLQFLSSLSPWSLVFILKYFGKQSNFYKYDIFYYLHFQYNGWFLFALIGLSFYLLERRNITINIKQVNLIHILLLVAVFFGYFSNTLWAKPGIFYNLLALIGGAAEIVVLFIFLQVLLRYKRYIRQGISDFSYRIFTLVLFLLLLKSILQFMGSFQYYADLSYHIRDIIISYLHLVMLGIFTPFLLVLSIELKFIKLNKKYFYIFYSGFIITETLLVVRGIFRWFNIITTPEIFHWGLFIFTFWMFLGVVGMGWQKFNYKYIAK